ncbi:hypothetical protein WJX72_008776 [[Myrmecia] bisecta]|uniref:Uncharacterized protein n=1 Tax=[Myrmecia] bisecta TaxID=41462 RepID=A0AAW1PLV0_9CHLO
MAIAGIDLGTAEGQTQGCAMEGPLQKVRAAFAEESLKDHPDESKLQRLKDAVATLGASAAAGSRVTVPKTFCTRYEDHAPSSFNAKTFAAEQACNPTLVTRRDCSFVQEFCDVSLRFYKKQDDRQKKLWALLSMYLGVNVQEFVAVVPDKQIKCDGFIGSRDLAIAILECENELGATQSDKYAQGQTYYARFWLARQDGMIYCSSCCPSFLVEFQGPCCRISGMSLFDRVHTKSLTQTLFLSVLPHAPVQQQLCNVFAALRKGVKRLQDIYGDIVNTAASCSDATSPRRAAFEMAMPFVFRPDNPVDLPPLLAGMEVMEQLVATKYVYLAMFVDFDWAGFEGVSRYPLHMNHAHIKWPNGAADNAPMLQQHDWEFLESMQVPPAMPYTWKADNG